MDNQQCAITVVSNSDTEGAYAFIHQMQDHERCREALKCLIYYLVVNSFIREKKMEPVPCLLLGGFDSRHSESGQSMRR